MEKIFWCGFLIILGGMIIWSLIEPLVIKVRCSKCGKKDYRKNFNQVVHGMGAESDGYVEYFCISHTPDCTFFLTKTNM